MEKLAVYQKNHGKSKNFQNTAVLFLMTRLVRYLKRVNNIFNEKKMTQSVEPVGRMLDNNISIIMNFLFWQCDVSFQVSPGWRMIEPKSIQKLSKLEASHIILKLNIK